MTDKKEAIASDAKNHPRVVFFTLNASHSHTSLSLRCLADAVINSGYFSCFVKHAGKTEKYAEAARDIQPCGGDGRTALDIMLIERTVSDMRDGVLCDLYESQGDIFVFSCYIWNTSEMLRQADNLKKLLPNASVIAGGPEISYRGDDFLSEHPYIDHIIRGEGEVALPKAIKAILSGEKPDRDIFGGHYRGFEKDGTHYSLFPPHDGAMVYYETSRGCPYGCGYCVSGIKDEGGCGIEYKSVEDALAGLLEFERYPSVKTVKLVDRTFNFDRRRADKIWKALSDDRFTKMYHFEICADLIDDESLSVLSAVPAGKFQFEIGVQSTNPETLAACRRSTNICRTLENTKKLHDLGNIAIHADLIAGLPHEGYSRFAVSFDDCYGICDELQLGFLKLLHGTALRAGAESFGCVYMSEAPYTVLYTNDITFGELQALHRISDTVNRFNPDRFGRSVGLLISAARSPFRFFEGLSEYIEKHSESRSVRGISQRRAYEYLYLYGLSLITDENDASALFDAIASDFAENEVGRLPFGIRNKDTKDNDKAYSKKITTSYVNISNK